MESNQRVATNSKRNLKSTHQQLWKYIMCTNNHGIAIAGILNKTWKE
jgi:hypothetical protein